MPVARRIPRNIFDVKFSLFKKANSPERLPLVLWLLSAVKITPIPFHKRDAPAPQQTDPITSRAFDSTATDTATGTYRADPTATNVPGSYLLSNVGEKIIPKRKIVYISATDSAPMSGNTRAAKVWVGIKQKNTQKTPKDSSKTVHIGGGGGSPPSSTVLVFIHLLLLFQTRHFRQFYRMNFVPNIYSNNAFVGFF
jgi:hypothetical protein